MPLNYVHVATRPQRYKSGVPKLSLAIYPFSISIDDHVPLIKFLMTKRLMNITKIYIFTNQHIIIFENNIH